MPIWRLAAPCERSGNCYMPRNSLAAAAVHQANATVYAVAGNMLDMAGGGARAEGIKNLCRTIVILKSCCYTVY
jgi:hypothetical protein